jgi:hypothetical protein
MADGLATLAARRVPSTSPALRWVRLIWRGTVQVEVGMHREPQKRIGRLNEAVHKTLEQFPPTKKTS